VGQKSDFSFVLRLGWACLLQLHQFGGRMNMIQRLILTFLPAGLAAEMRAESERWRYRCACGLEVSVGEIG
jgi:hypothetical protein